MPMVFQPGELTRNTAELTRVGDILGSWGGLDGLVYHLVNSGFSLIHTSLAVSIG